MSFYYVQSSRLRLALVILYGVRVSTGQVKTSCDTILEYLVGKNVLEVFLEMLHVVLMVIFLGSPVLVLILGTLIPAWLTSCTEFDSL